MSSVASRFV
jgi:hypothetical protein